jgi:hypothetical protein
MAAQLNNRELGERVAILKRFRTLLEQQRSKFREYLDVLERQQGKIEEDNDSALLAHAELEQQIVANIASLQKVIVPMQSLYHATAVGPGIPAGDDADVVKMQADLADLQNKVLAQNEKNRILLRAHISQIRTQLNNMKVNNPYRARQSIYAEHAPAGNLVAIDA